MNKKKSPLVFYYVEKRDTVSMGGKIIYIDHKNRYKMITKIKEFCDTLEDGNVSNIDNEKNLAHWIKKYGKRISQPHLRAKLTDINIQNQKYKYRNLSFVPEYREIKAIDPHDKKVTLGELNVSEYKSLYLLNEWRKWVIRRSMRRCTLIEKKLVEDVMNCELKTEKTKKENIIFVDFNTTNPFQNIFIIDDIKKLITNIPDNFKKTILMGMSDSGELGDLRPIQFEDFEKVPFLLSYVLDVLISKDECMISRINQEVLKHQDLLKLKQLRGVRRILTYPYPIIYNYVQENGYCLKSWKNLFKSFIHGNIDFSDYPNGKITVSHALDIDGDLLSTFNLTLKELDPNSFQYVEVDSSEEGKITRISLDGPITKDFTIVS